MLTNLEEYYFGFNPGSSAPVTGPVSILPPTAGANLQVRYVRRTDDPGLTYTLQFAAEVDGLYSPAATLVLMETMTTIDASYEWVHATIDPAAVSSTLFFNILVTE